jgi:hypothetical protein
MIEGFSLGSYLLLVDDTGRRFRTGKAALSRELAGILDSRGTSSKCGQARLERWRRGPLLDLVLAARGQLKCAPRIGGRKPGRR